MKILVVNTARRTGGAAKMASLLAETIAKSVKGSEIRFIHAESVENEGVYIGLKKPWSREINAALCRVFGSQVSIDFGRSGRIDSEANGVDLVHLHNLHGYYLDYLRVLKKLKNKPIVWTWHDMWGATGRCGFSYECTNWKNGCRRCPHLGYYPAAWRDNARTEYSDKERIYKQLTNLHIVTPSEWLRNIAIERGFSEERVSTVPNPVSLTDFGAMDKREARAKLGLNVDKPYIAFVAAKCGDKRKGYGDFIEIVKALEVEAIVVGQGAYEKSEGFRNFGRVTEFQRMSLLYSASDALIIPSAVDNYPNTVIESYACGTPVFGYAVGGIPSQISSAEEALVRSGDVSALVRKLRTYFEAGGKNNEKSLQLRRYAEEKWAPKKVAQLYLDIYEATIARGRSAEQDMLESQ